MLFMHSLGGVHPAQGFGIDVTHWSPWQNEFAGHPLGQIALVALGLIRLKAIAAIAQRTGRLALVRLDIAVSPVGSGGVIAAAQRLGNRAARVKPTARTRAGFKAR